MASIIKKQGAFLPHWSVSGGIYAVRFRLADSVPQEQLREWTWEREGIAENARKQGRALTPDERQRLLVLHTETIDRYLRSGRGACWLQRPDIASLVVDAVKHFDGERYKLFAWSLMPNHVHVVVQPHDSYTLSSILQSWKGFSARKSNQMLKRLGSFWQRESFDRIIRNADHLHQCMEYVWSNPEMAGHKEWEWRWRMDPKDLGVFLARYEWPSAASKGRGTMS